MKIGIGSSLLLLLDLENVGRYSGFARMFTKMDGRGSNNLSADFSQCLIFQLYDYLKAALGRSRGSIHIKQYSSRHFIDLFVCLLY